MPETHILRPDLIRDTVGQLALRINDRFPRSGLASQCAHLLRVVTEAEKVAAIIHRPLWSLRLLMVGVITCFVALLVYAVIQFDPSPGLGLSEFIQTSEAAANDLIFLAVAVYFLWSLDNRIKRRRVLARLNHLRELAHLIDMHQLTKDPHGLAAISQPTPHSPKREMTPIELGRYLDYCSEILALISKVGAVYVARFDDPEALEVASDLEALCTGLSQKIWQKLIILRQVG